LPTFVARSYVKEGLLEEITLKEPPLVFGDLVLFYPSSGQISKKVTAFRDSLVKATKSGGPL